MIPDMVCTLFPDGVPAWLGGAGDEWRSCCIGHDLSTLPMVASDFEMAACMSALGYPAIGAVALFGLLTLGIPYRLVMRRIHRRRRD